jgi:hypothetical protein
VPCLLSEKRERRFIIGEVTAQNLDCNGITTLDFVAFVNFSHAASAQVLVDLVDAIEPRPGRKARASFGVGQICITPQTSTLFVA